MTGYFIAKYLHILGAILILGTSAGIAFFMRAAHRSSDSAFIAAMSDTVIIADLLFVASAMVLQPFTGGALMVMSSTTTDEPWIVASLVLYALAGLLWVPLLFMQIEIRNLARQAVAEQAPLPPRYHTLFRRGAAFGLLGFAAMLAIVWLMIAKPSF